MTAQAAMTTRAQRIGGLALCEQYYQEYGRKLVKHHFAHERNRIAAGLVGMGSECLGYDDELSRDHDWGPGFCLWLNREDYDRFGQALQQGYNELPTTFRGLQRQNSAWGKGRLGVVEIGTFYRSFLGLALAPTTELEWLVIPQANLAACCSGKVFTDPSGEFSAVRRKLLAYYPRDVQLKKIAARCMSAGRAGQYNFQRSLQRNDGYGTAHALVQFCEDIFSLVFLLNRRFMPHFKWHCRGAEELPLLGKPVSGQIQALVSAGEPQVKTEHITEICKKTCEELRQQGLSQNTSHFLLDHGPEIHDRIESSDLRKLDIWYGGG